MFLFPGTPAQGLAGTTALFKKDGRLAIPQVQEQRVSAAATR